MRINLASRSSSRCSQIAYTLAEVMVGVAIMGILFVSLYGGMSSGFAVTQVSRENLRATQILIERMEGIRLYNWNQLIYSNWVPATFTAYYYPMTNRGESPGIVYSGTMTIVKNPPMYPASTYNTNIAAVTVKVDWISANIPRTRSITTYVSRNGVQNYVYNN